jgi:hypothetical protein
MTETQEDRLSWVREDPDLVTRLDAAWPGWAEPGEHGLAAALDQEPDWSGWEHWDADVRRNHLATTLDRWYPQDRLGWVRADPDVVTRLDAVWPGWDRPGEHGLAATLDAQPGWEGWDAWDPHARMSYLKQTLDTWYPPQDDDAQGAGWYHAEPPAEGSAQAPAATPVEAQPEARGEAAPDAAAPDAVVVDEAAVGATQAIAQKVADEMVGSGVLPAELAEELVPMFRTTLLEHEAATAMTEHDIRTLFAELAHELAEADQ